MLLLMDLVEQKTHITTKQPTNLQLLHAIMLLWTKILEK